MKRTAFAFSTVAILVASPALAASVPVKELLSTCNVVTKGDFTVSSQKVEGRLLIGGNLSGGTLRTAVVNLDPGPAPPSMQGSPSSTLA